MSDRTSHAETWHDDLAAYALDALGEREALRVADHVADCDSCRERVRWLTPAVNVLPATVVQQEPPPELRERLMAIVEREAAEAAGETEPAVAPARKRRRRISLPGFSIALRPALASFGIALLLIAGVAGYSLRDGSSTEAETTFTAQPTATGSLASGMLEVSGDDGSLQVANLPAPGRDEVYQAWVQHNGHNGRIVPSSVFVVNDEGAGEVAIPSGLEGADRVMVTREPEGGSEKPTEGALLIANLK